MEILNRVSLIGKAPALVEFQGHITAAQRRPVLSRNSLLVDLGCGSLDDLESQFGGFRLEVFDL
jgi:hypothetical protein